MNDPRNTDKLIGQIEICVHRARSIRNICIYQNQDVYAKIFLSDKPENKISTNVIDEGGQNPVFNESLRLDISAMDSWLRFEVWMMSRIKNYLEDQMLGLLLLPLRDVVSDYCGKPATEFELSSTDLFHSPAGFVELSFNKYGANGGILVMEMPKSTHHSESGVLVPPDSDSIIGCEEVENVEFPDETMAKEHKRMVSEYLMSYCPLFDHDEGDERDDDCDGERRDDDDGANKRSKESGGGDDAESHIIEVVSVESEENVVVEEEIVDMYKKSMQQFTDALAKMRLPMDVAVADATKGEKTKAARVFYGSRAFF